MKWLRIPPTWVIPVGHYHLCCSILGVAGRTKQLCPARFPVKLLLAGAHTPGRRGVSAEQVSTALTALVHSKAWPGWIVALLC